MSTREAEIAARAEKATKGPWSFRPDHSNAIYDADGRFVGSAYNGNGWADGQFIAHAREDIPYLLSQNATLREALTELVGRIANGHVQSIGSIGNVRMVQFGVDELERARAALALGGQE